MSEAITFPVNSACRSSKQHLLLQAEQAVILTSSDAQRDASALSVPEDVHPSDHPPPPPPQFKINKTELTAAAGAVSFLPLNVSLRLVSIQTNT